MHLQYTSHICAFKAHAGQDEITSTVSAQDQGMTESAMKGAE